jgi:hypothetical protein
MPKARTTAGGIRSCGWLILKFSNDRSVCAPQYLSEATCTSPKASVSVRVDCDCVQIHLSELILGNFEHEHALIKAFCTNHAGALYEREIASVESFVLELKSWRSCSKAATGVSW